MERCRFELRARERKLELGARTALMGVVNVTPDSFYQGSRFLEAERAVTVSLQMVRAGADILDIGGESTRPGARAVSAAEELDRVLPVLRSLRKRTDALISIDTRKATVAEKALELGADIINDVSSLNADPDMARVVADSQAGLVLMHMKGSPETMQRDPRYKNVVEDVKRFLADAVNRAESHGISRENLLVDPGIGFGKTARHNLTLLNRLSDLAELKRPLLVGTSRKSFIGKLVGTGAEDRLWGTAATAAAAIFEGAHILRVHDVLEMSQVARVSDALLSERFLEPETTRTKNPNEASA